jgi:hypothetical protein
MNIGIAGERKSVITQKRQLIESKREQGEREEEGGRDCSNVRLKHKKTA